MSLKERLNLDKDPIFLVDGHAFLYRFFYANPGISRSDGTPTNAIYMFVRMLFGLLRGEHMRYACFLFDGKGTTFRHTLYDAYKAQRSPMPEDLAAQIDDVLRAIKLLGVKTITSDGNEADDCIASMAQRFKTKRPVVIVGADKDLKQCLDERVFMWDPGSKKDKITTLEEFKKETGLEPSQWPDFQAIIGDSADNIPGIPKVGPKTAYKIMADNPTLEALKETVIKGEGDFTPGLRRNLEQHINDAFIYRKLTTLQRDGCQGMDIEDFVCQEPDAQAVQAFLEEFEFRTLLRELPSVLKTPNQPVEPKPRAKDAPPAPAPQKPKAAATQQDQATLFDLTPSATPKAEVNRLTDPEQLPIPDGATLGLVPDEASGGFFIGLEQQEWLYTGPVPALVKRLSQCAAVACPDVKALLRQDQAWDDIAEAKWFDLGLAAYLLSPEDRNYSWERLARRLAPELLPQPVAGEGCTAAAMVEALRARLANEHLDALMRDLETPLLGMLARMEAQGIRIDAEALQGFLDEVQDQMQGLSNRIKKLAGREFNLRSSQQLAEILFTDLGLKPRGKTPGGQPSTAFDVLEKIRHEHPIVEAIQSWRKLEKMRSTYLEPLPRAADADGRIRTTFNQLATATGRLSSSRPNLQNIPIRGDMGRRMRACFIAEPGTLLVAADYSQVELRVLAHFSKEQALIDAFRQGKDIHSRTASLLFDHDIEAVSREERSSAKTINFGLIYGMGPQKLAADLGIKLNEAKDFIARYFERLPGLKAFYDEVEQNAREHGFVTTLAGRRRLLPHINAKSKQQQSLARRQAINTLIQGSAADIIKLAMLAADRDAKLKDLGARLILQVHDELLMECPTDAATAAGEHLASVMEQVTTLLVPLAVDWGSGHNWDEAH